MSSQFNYELDERQIRILMQDAELEYNEALWQKFETSGVIEAKSSIIISNYIPKINVSISRSIIVPILFITLIGGLSGVLFSIVDFKKKEAIKKEIPYEAKSIITSKPDVTKNTKIKSIQPAKGITTNSIVLPSKSVVSTNSLNIDTNLEAIKTEIIKPIEVKAKEESPLLLITQKEIKKPSEKKKKRRKTQPVELPIINTSSNLNEGVSEVELDLK